MKEKINILSLNTTHFEFLFVLNLLILIKDSNLEYIERIRIKLFLKLNWLFLPALFITRVFRKSYFLILIKQINLN